MILYPLSDLFIYLINYPRLPTNSLAAFRHKKKPDVYKTKRIITLQGPYWFELHIPFLCILIHPLSPWTWHFHLPRYNSVHSTRSPASGIKSWRPKPMTMRIARMGQRQNSSQCDTSNSVGFMLKSLRNRSRRCK